MLTSDFFYMSKSIQSERIDNSTCEHFFHEDVPNVFEIDEHKIYFRFIENINYVYIFTIKNKVPIYHGILDYEVFQILVNTNDKARLKLIGTRLQNDNPVNIANRRFRYTLYDAEQIKLDLFR
jgi:hypothetical protein